MIATTESLNTMSRKDVAAACRVCVKTVVRLEKRGLLRGVRIGRGIRFPVAEVARLLAETSAAMEEAAGVNHLRRRSVT
jgi:hypothetical protein